MYIWRSAILFGLGIAMFSYLACVVFVTQLQNTCDRLEKAVAVEQSKHTGQIWAINSLARWANLQSTAQRRQMVRKWSGVLTVTSPQPLPPVRPTPITSPQPFASVPGGLAADVSSAPMGSEEGQASVPGEEGP
ncbi:MAG: hypothetical protein J7M26_06060 [Armatimonadetes bacterium]|nr:hypothetical protein [Armatimonadota bacterium]